MDILWIGLVGCFFVYFLWRFLDSGTDRMIKQAIENKELEPILLSLSKKSLSKQPTAFNRVIRILWDNYQRELAIQLVKVLAEKYSNAHISQYWLKQAITVEPQLAGQTFQASFLDSYYQPEVAAKCGPVG